MKVEDGAGTENIILDVALGKACGDSRKGFKGYKNKGTYRLFL